MVVSWPSCVGLDVHKRRMMASWMPPDSTGQQADGLIEVKEFTILPHDLLALSDGLAAADLTHVAMESTGEYWKPIFTRLEESF